NRLNGYRDALRHYGLPLDPELVIAYDLNLDKANIYVNHLLSLPNPPDALFAMNDPTALEALNVAKRRGIAVPDDLAIVGFSDDPMSALIEPGLTTVAQPVNEIGQQAARLLLSQLLRTDDGYQPEQIVLPTNLIVRGSTVSPEIAGQRAATA
ncbi:MAG TPA: substrate-binding domain-containing protein, partial [Fibrella sp.]